MKNTNRIATLKDIAKEVGISATAVSKALNNRGGISRETEKRVKEVAGALNYKPNIVAKSLKTNETRTIGVVVSDSSHSMFAKVVKGIEDAAVKEEYSIILCNTNQDYEREKHAINVLINKRVDGIILAASMLTSENDYEYLKSFGVPFVFLIRRSKSPEADYVINDNVQGAYMITDYLLKRRHSPIYFLNLPEDSPSGIDRLEGYKKALKENETEFTPSIVYNVKTSIDEGYIGMRQLLDRGEEIKTVFCGCDVIAIGAIEAILEKGLKVPDDIGVAAYDDIDFAAYLRVPLTTVKQPKYAIGSKGIEVLIQKIRNKALSTQRIILKPELVIRLSA